MSLDMCRIYLKRHRQQMYITRDKKLKNEIALRTNLQDIYWLFYRLDTTTHNESSAFKNYIRATQWEDSIYNEQSKRQTAMLQGEYETESAQNQIAILVKDNEVKNIKLKQSTIYLFVMGGFVVIIFLMAILFIRQNKIKAEHQMVVLEQKLLRSQMNPHFIFNSLANIQEFIWKKDPLTANEYLSSFSKLVRLILENSRNDFVPVEKEISTIENYLNLQKLRFRDKFEYSIKVDPEIDKEDMLIPPMLVQPFIENSIEHGISTKETTGHIDVSFFLEKDKINIEVKDDGIGFKKSTELKKDLKKDHQSLAMTITRERLMMHYKKYKREIRLSISDITDEHNQVMGARVLFGIPYNQTYG